MTALPIYYTEAALAWKFAADHVGRIKYVSAISSRHKWFILDEDTGAWQCDETLHVLALICDYCVKTAKKAATDTAYAATDTAYAATIDTAYAAYDDKWPEQMCSANFISGVERLARCNRRLAATREDVGIKRRTTKKKGGAA